ncbi:MAG: hypothetical protein HQ521_00385 [Bacteroidetes bacterium]|nr:hypothetical protein [Bacteroidota bacterium]
MHSKNFLYLIISLILFNSCGNFSSKGPKIDESKLKKVDIKIHRYGKALFELDTTNFLEDVRSIQSKFSLFLGNDIENHDKIAPLYEYVTDTQLISISKKVTEIYPDILFLKNQLADAFSRYIHFFPHNKPPIVYTYISDLYYEKPVIIDDSIIIIALDVYLGPEFTKYRSLGLPHYKIRRMTSDNIVIDIMKELYNTKLDKHYKQKTLIDRMVNGGKLLYFLDAVTPNTPDSLKIGYTSDQVNWVESNKSNVWAFLVKNKLFYSADYKIQSNLIEDGPFTSGFSNESPPRLGIWLGWQIVRQYMDKHPNITIKELINNPDSQEIFNQSGYKP